MRIVDVTVSLCYKGGCVLVSSAGNVRIRPAVTDTLILNRREKFHVTKILKKSIFLLPYGDLSLQNFVSTFRSYSKTDNLKILSWS